MANSYKEAGVDIEKGDRFAEFIGSMASKAVSKGIGGFAGGIEIDLNRYKEPVLLSCTDGVGTKLLAAQKLGVYDTVGIDLVAMSVNDLVVCGAQPLSFLDYIACGAVDEEILHPLMKGIVKGCELADCELTGGETAEMPDLYAKGDFDLAGFCTGLVDKSKRLPRTDKISDGDPIYGLASDGIHSNGLSLARKAAPDTEEAWKELLTPTKIYVRDFLPLAESGLVNAGAHITGGGLEANFQRVLPEGLTGSFTWDWPVPPVFDMIQTHGKIETAEMRKVFNMGIGLAFTCPAADAPALEKLMAERGLAVRTIGEVVRG